MRIAILMGSIMVSATVLVSCAASRHGSEARASGAASGTVNLRERGVVLPPGGVHEACFEADESMRVVYSYEATGALDFNIHYHEDEKIGYPVKVDGSRSERGELAFEFAQTYCLMWTNSWDEPVTLDFEARVE